MTSKYFEFLENSGKIPRIEAPLEDDLFSEMDLGEAEAEELPSEDSEKFQPKDFSNALKMRALRARRGLK